MDESAQGGGGRASQTDATAPRGAKAAHEARAAKALRDNLRRRKQASVVAPAGPALPPDDPPNDLPGRTP